MMKSTIPSATDNSWTDFTYKGKGKVYHTPLRERRQVLISLSKALSP